MHNYVNSTARFTELSARTTVNKGLNKDVHTVEVKWLCA